MSARPSAEPFVPEKPTLPKLRSAAATCKGCELWKSGTQTVFGEGTTRAELMLVGEQPGDKEDLAGEPFVGPAGRLLDRALEAADIDRRKVYVTNIVKHFKWEARGKRRIHKKPNLTEVAACKPWLEAEMSVVRPKVVVALGATAAQGLLGKDFRVTKQRGEPVETDFGVTVATIHPSAILRARDEDERRTQMEGFISDLRVAAKELANAQ